jgi:prephenate dehydrogenase
MDSMFKQVLVIGVGLIGGSLARGLKERGLAQRVIGVSPAEGMRPLQLGLVDALETDLAMALAGSDLLILGVPPSAVTAELAKAMPHLPENCLVTDVSSAKTLVLPHVQALMGERYDQFVSSHPIAGSDRGGPEAAHANLFAGAKVVINPHVPESLGAKKNRERVESMWVGLGARVLHMGMQEHDEIYAAVSHLPHAAAFALCRTLAHMPMADALLQHGGAGLRDTSRVGASGADLWADILLANRVALMAQMTAFQAQWEALSRALDHQDREQLKMFLQEAGDWRRRLQD